MIPDNRQEMKFIFTDQTLEDAIQVKMGADGPPEYNEEMGYGFVRATCAVPPREVSFDSIVCDSAGFHVTVSDFYEEQGMEFDHFNHYGLAFRVKAPPGAYEIKVRTTSSPEHTMVAISGMHADRILGSGFWDAAHLVPIRHHAAWQGREWTFTYANGRPFLDIEIEPRIPGVPVGIEQILIRPISRKRRAESERLSIFVLGDSTAKSNVFEDAPMCGWGQVFSRLFDLHKVNVVNYSQGGRSFRNAYAEGRFNDLVLTGAEGDIVLIQFGHNDERGDEWTRYGRGSTEESYASWISDVYIPAVRARGMIPVLVTPTSRVHGDAAPGHRYEDSFTYRKFPMVMRRQAERLNVMLLDMTTASVNYYNEIGVEGTTAVFMSIEAGETPGKTNDGSLANGHPANRIDGTHYKEALAKQYARMAVMELSARAGEGDEVALRLLTYLAPSVLEALQTNDWSKVYPEVAVDTISGPGAYYRNQIEKMLQLGVMNKDEAGRFRPDDEMRVAPFKDALVKLMGIEAGVLAPYSGDNVLTREVMAAIIYDAYRARFNSKPAYMTEYNKRTAKPGDSGYDPNLDTGAQDVMYDPLVPFEHLKDAAQIDPLLAERVRGAYQLGLVRAEKGIARGRMMNGDEFEPKLTVTRGKAAKMLYYMWVLVNPVKRENHRLFEDVV